MARKQFEIFQGEAKTVLLNIVDENGDAVDVSEAEMEFKAAAQPGEDSVISLDDTAFSSKGSGSAEMALSATDTDVDPGTYVCQFKTIFSASNIDINQEISLVINQAL